VGLAVVSALPNVARYTPGGLSSPGAALANGVDAGDVLGPVLANIGLVIVLVGAAWLSFRRQEL